MPDKYTNYDELSQNERLNADYAILHREVDSKIVVISPHGGGIEPGTIDIGDAIAGCDHTFYAFKGLKKSGNKILHITSNSFDEPLGIQVAQKALIVISVHGSRFRTETVHIGGRNQLLKQKILHALKAAGFNAEISELPELQWISPENICNRCKSGEGVHLEISRGLREKMFDNLDIRSLRKRTKCFYKFVNTLKAILSI
ncbi:hypothetical protein HRM2_17210 [Desulforapulum autotrophicum HRM2]|uniref:Phage-related replication protein n=1 Tax=Desulforapulum autotrophicum (strain ATCC 43914 / DSM 3382 / VKM B-1955 / HRM2) TaxID=177437 RepID=C0QB28_DESAH|nr:poly-gamma-glutamate hydrolase family protein [Desulforapulum autotrophicum]ACN14827.1 hypothetical protein HRM2_17210 [Desulforapulum autotrophicum HRM2]